jgi:hypothetical protein
MQDDAAAPQAYIPPPQAPRRSRTPFVIGFLVAAILLIPFVLVGLGVVFLRAGGTEAVEVGGAEREVFVTDGDFDMAMDVEIILESGPSISLPGELVPGEDRGVNEGTLQKVASVTSPSGTTDLYTYEAILLDSANGDTLDCLGALNNSGGSVACHSGDENSPIFMWGSEDRTSGTWYSIAVAGLPMEATTLVSETTAGRLVGSTVINGVAYQEWPAGEGSTGGLLTRGGRDFGEPTRTVALDVQGIVVWSTTGGN